MTLEYTERPYATHPPEMAKIIGRWLPMVTKAKIGTTFRLVTHSVTRAYSGHHAGYYVATKVWNDGTVWYVPLKEARPTSILVLNHNMG